MSRRRNHTAMGLAFVLGCLVIAFAIYLGLKNASSETANSSVAPAATNSAVASNGASGAPSSDVDWRTLGGLTSFQFAAYPASSFVGPKVLPKFSGTGKAFSEYHTRITEDTAKGPNFAGHYTVVSIGCGTECTWSVIVDNSSGQIQSFEIGGHGSGDESTTDDFDFQLGSNLLKEVASDPADQQGCLYSAYLWTGTGLKLIGRQKARLAAGETSEGHGCATTAAVTDANPDVDVDQASAPPQSPTSIAPAPPGVPASSPDDLQAADLPHQSFVQACVEKAFPGFDGIDGDDQPALCECIYNRVRSYGTLTKANGQLALNICKLQWVTDRNRFEHDYAPTDDAAGNSPSSGVGPQPQ